MEAYADSWLTSIPRTEKNRAKTEEMEVKIVSEELVKPSSPTPPHLRTFNLCLLDQLISFPHIPVILFYPSNSEPEPRLDVLQKLDLLKRSLSLTLTRFYPLAGKIGGGGLYVECDDEGARFLEARVNMSMTQFLTDPDHVLLRRLLPCDFLVDDSVELSHAANFQANVFECGGIAIGVCTTHKLLDGTAAGVFLNEWTALARGGGEVVNNGRTTAAELMGAADRFPANDLCLRDVAKIASTSMYKTGSCVTARFLFSGPAIEALRALGKGPAVKNPTRVEAVSGFLWKCIIGASMRNNDGIGRPSTFTHMVNIRKRMNPPMSDFSLGNLIWVAVAYHSSVGSGRADDLLPSLVGDLRGAISNVNGDFLSGLSRDKNLIFSCLEEIVKVGSSKEVDHIACSSWCKSGFYDANFGWGRPVWASSIALPGPTFPNLIFLVDTRSGDGTEAWVTLDEHEMSLLQEDLELKSFASMNPSPLKINGEP